MRGRIKLIVAGVGMVLLLLIAFALVRGVAGVVRLSADAGDSEPDPMFAEPAAQVTRPPDASAEDAPVVSADDDPSRDWVYETLTPVEQTAAELAGE